MFKFFQKLKLVFTYSGELDRLLFKMKTEREAREREERMEYVNLCKRHQPREPGAHYNSENCDICARNSHISKIQAAWMRQIND